MANELIIEYLENSDLTYEEKSEFFNEFNKLGNSLFVNYFIENTYHPKHIITAMKDFNALDNNGKSELLYELMEGFYKEYPVDIITFIRDPYYLGEIYNDNIFPMWEKLLLEIYPAPLLTNYSEVIISAALRSGKSTSAVISFLYEMYKLMCMVNPARDLAGKSTATLTFAALSKDDSNAIGILATQVFSGLTTSPFFIDNISSNMAFSDVGKKGMKITDYIMLKAGSSAGTVTGLDVYCGILDEANMPTPKISIDQLVDKRISMYEDMVYRKQSTFSKAPDMSGIMWLISSPTDEGDVIGKRIEKIEANKEIVNVKILDNIAVWEARDEGSPHTFDFFLGSDTKDPHIIENEADKLIYPIDKVLTIPYKYFTNFKTEPTKSVRDIAGRRTLAECSLFNSVSIFEKVFSKEQDIFSKNIIEVNFIDPEKDYTGKNVNFYNVSDYLLNKDYFNKPNKPDCYRYIHLDIASKKDRFGMSSVYSDLVTFESEHGEKIKKRLYYIDFCLGVVAKTGQQVDLLKTLDFICELRKAGYPVKLVTTDNHQGVLARQIITKKSIKTEYLSVEASKDPYYNLKNIIIQEELIGYKNPTLTGELKGLKDYPKKIGKSLGYTDDLSDSLAGALYSCTMDKYYKNLDNLIVNFPENYMNNSNNNTPNSYNGVDLNTLLFNNTSNTYTHNTGKLGLGY